MGSATILILLAGIVRHGSGSSAAIAFESALRRVGREAYAAGGSAALHRLRRQIAAADQAKAAVHADILAAAWSDISEQPDDPARASRFQRRP
jgi:hypothetical protein